MPRLNLNPNILSLSLTSDLASYLEVVGLSNVTNWRKKSYPSLHHKVEKDIWSTNQRKKFYPSVRHQIFLKAITLICSLSGPWKAIHSLSNMCVCFG